MHQLKCVRFVFSAIIVLLLIQVSRANAEDTLDQMISPVTNPVNFEDPRIQTSLRPIFMYHKSPSDFVIGSGDIQVWAAQLRVALTDRLAFLATKDGYIQINADKVLDDSEGAANLAAGFQYAFIKDKEQGAIVSAGLRYEWQTGDPEVFQGQGDGVLNPHISYAQALGPINTIAYTGLRLGVDDQSSDFWDLSVHVDYPIGSFYPLLELNMVHVLSAGDRIGLAQEGFDLVNFGSSDSDGNTVVTMGVGARYRVSEMLDLGLAYEFPVSDDKDIFDWRLTTDVIVKTDWVLFN